MQEISVYHAIILISDTALIPGASETSRTYANTKTTLSWRSKEYGSSITKSVEFKYDGRLKILVIGDQEFSTSEQKMFVVTIGPEWSISTVQVNGRLEDRTDATSVLLKFKEFDQSPKIQKLELAE